MYVAHICSRRGPLVNVGGGAVNIHIQVMKLSGIDSFVS